MDKIILETMETYNEYLNKLKKGILPLVNSFRNYNGHEAIQTCLVLFEGVEWILSVNTKLNELNYLNELDVNKFNNILREITETIEIRDFNTCADILEYELLEAVKDIKPYVLEGAQHE